MTSTHCICIVKYLEWKTQLYKIVHKIGFVEQQQLFIFNSPTGKQKMSLKTLRKLIILLNGFDGTMHTLYIQAIRKSLSCLTIRQRESRTPKNSKINTNNWHTCGQLVFHFLAYWMLFDKLFLSFFFHFIIENCYFFSTLHYCCLLGFIRWWLLWIK